MLPLLSSASALHFFLFTRESRSLLPCANLMFLAPLVRFSQVQQAGADLYAVWLSWADELLPRLPSETWQKQAMGERLGGPHSSLHIPALHPCSHPGHCLSELQCSCGKHVGVGQTLIEGQPCRPPAVQSEASVSSAQIRPFLCTPQMLTPIS